MKPLTKSMKGLHFEFLGYRVGLNFAKTLLWSKEDITEHCHFRKTCLLDLSFETREYSDGVLTRSISIVFLPFRIMIGKRVK